MLLVGIKGGLASMSGSKLPEALVDVPRGEKDKSTADGFLKKFTFEQLDDGIENE